MSQLHIRVCTNVSCMLRGGDDVYDAVHDHVKRISRIRTATSTVIVERTTCLGHCTHAPIVAINTDLFKEVSVDDLPELYKEYGL